MSFLPGSLTPAFRSPWCAHIVASLRRRTYSIRTVIQLSDVEKQKEPITQSTRTRREHSSRFKVMFYVIGSENSKSGSAFFLLPPTEPKAWWSSSILPVYRYRVGLNQLIKSQYGRTFLFSCLCSGVPLCHYYTDNVLCRQGCKPSHYIRNFKRQISTVAEKFSLPVRTFSREISMGKK